MVRSRVENERYQEDLIITFVLLFVLSSSFVALRTFVKLKSVRNLGAEDIASLAAFVCLVPVEILMIPPY